MKYYNSLTTRESEVLQLISHGLTTKEIASSLFLSSHTVDSHRKRLMEKMDARNTAVMIRLGFEAGILKLN